MILIYLFFFVVGLVFLVKGSGFFVKSAASIAKKLGVSDFIIGLTLVAVGTSIPELAASIVAALRAESGLVIGTAIGANIARIALVIGSAALVAIIKTKEEMVDRDGYIMLFAAALFMVFIYNGVLSRLEAFVLLMLFVAYNVYLFEAKPKLEGRYRFKQFLDYFLRFRYVLTIKSKIVAGINHTKNGTGLVKIRQLFMAGLFKDSILLILSGTIIVIGANYLVECAVFFADLLKVPHALIGVTIIAIGTSLPELSVVISAARKGFGNIAVGTIVGSNIAHIFLIVGLSGLINPLTVSRISIFYMAPFMLLMSLFLLFFIRSNWEIRREEGAVLIFFYAIFMVVLFFGGLI
jgi:cation:H+ antiporter